jgi:hypothetical protein
MPLACCAKAWCGHDACVRTILVPMVGLGAAQAMFGDCVSDDAVYVSFVALAGFRGGGVIR